MKITLDDTAGGYNLQTINNNFQKLEDALNNEVLYRDNPGVEANAMASDLDMNSQRIFNLPEPISLNEAARLQDVINAVNGGGGQANLVTFTPANDITSTNVQAAIEEVDLEMHTADTQIRLDLIDTSSLNKGAGAVGFNFALNYPIGSVGAFIKTLSAGSGVWGSITGVLTDQADLVAALNTKAPTSLFTSVANGLVPASGGGTVNFLRADGSFAAPPGTGSVSISGTPTNGQVGVWVSASALSGVTPTGTVAPVFSTNPVLVTPNIGTPSAGVLTNCTGLPVAGGGTGRATSTTAYGLIAAGTTATGPLQTLPAGATTEILVGAGASALPIWTTATGTGAPVRASAPIFASVPMTAPGAVITTPSAVGSNAIDMNLALQTYQVPASNPTLTLLNGPGTTGQAISVLITGDTQARTVTLPAGTWRSDILQATMTSFVVPANATTLWTILKTAAGYTSFNEPQPFQRRSWSRGQEAGANVIKVLQIAAPQGGTINAIYGKTTSGTITVQVRINGANVTGGSLAITSTRGSSNATATNVFVKDDVIDIVYSSNSSAVQTDITIQWTPAGV